MVNFKITQCYRIHEVNNCMCHNFYYIYKGRMYNEKKTKYRKFKFIMWADIFDLMEHYEADSVTSEQIDNYFKHDLDISSMLYSIKNFDDVEHIKEFYKECNDTIKDFSRIL